MHFNCDKFPSKLFEELHHATTLLFLTCVLDVFPTCGEAVVKETQVVQEKLSERKQENRKD
jgi:hypothetical protein